MSFSQPRLHASTILLCDDDVEILDLLKPAFIDAGHEVIAVRTSEEAWKILNLQKIDCVLSDMRIGEGSGVELAKTIHQEFSSIRRYLMTDFQDDQGHEAREF